MAEGGWVYWGKYQPATIVSIQAGLYEARYEDGVTRWLTACELLSSTAPAMPPNPGTPTTVLASDGTDSYSRCTFLSERNGSWVVRADNGGSSGQEQEVAVGRCFFGAFPSLVVHLRRAEARVARQHAATAEGAPANATSK